MRNKIYFNHKDLSDFGVFIANAGVYNSPARGYDKVSVPGRNGDVIFEKERFENIEHTYPAVIYKDFDVTFDALKAYLLSCEGYAELQDSFHPEEYYVATFVGIDNIKVPRDHSIGSFELTFDRKPQKFLVEGKQTQTFNAFPVTMLNPTPFYAYPLIRLYGSGTLTMGDVELVLSTSASYVDIDCDLQEALQAGENLNITLTDGKFPRLAKGLNTINWTGSKIEITPRWYTI